MTMSTLVVEAEPHRIPRREDEAHIRNGEVTPTPSNVPDATYLGYVGAHFPPGSRKGSFPVYPDIVDVSEDEATTAQSDATTPCTYELPHSHAGGLWHTSSSAPARDPRHDRHCISDDDFTEFQRQRSNKARHRNGSTRSYRSQTSTPPQTQEMCMSTISSHSEYSGPTTPAPPHGYTSYSEALAAFPESHTPSHCSAVTDEEGPYMEGVGPSPPHPYSTWDQYESQHQSEDAQTSDNAWQWGDRS